MDTDSFWQQLDSEDLLKRHGPELAAEAREALSGNPAARMAGMITTADSADATAVRTALEQAAGLATRAVDEARCSRRCDGPSWRQRRLNILP